MKNWSYWIDEATDALYKGYVDFCYLINFRSDSTSEELHKTREEAEKNMQTTFPEKMELVYKRYWKLSTRLFWL